MATTKPANVTELLLVRSGLVFVETVLSAKAVLTPSQVRGFELELAQLGYVASKRLRDKIAFATGGELTKLLNMISVASQRTKGGHSKLSPLFRRFPDDVPSDTVSLWWGRVAVRYLQQPTQPCVLCGNIGTVHVLNPCMDLVCDQCFDGSNYSGCPICNRKVEPTSPFFRDAPAKKPTAISTATFMLLDLGNTQKNEQGPAAARTKVDACREIFVTLCQRTQVMSPVDVDALLLIVQTFPDDVVGWLPLKIPVRENIAIIFGELLKAAVATKSIATLSSTLQRAASYLTTATDVLRLITAYSGGSPALLPVEKWEKVSICQGHPSPIRGCKNASLDAPSHACDPRLIAGSCDVR
jgi:hypothetical protein